MSLPGLTRDTFTVSRSTTSVDTEGVNVGTASVVLSGYGTWGTPSTSDQQDADQRGQSLDAVLATGVTGIVLEDVITVRGKSYVVIGITDARFHNRIRLQRVDL